MLTDFIITFRETLEIALVVGIVLSYLEQLNNRSWFKTVYYALATGIILSVALGYFFEMKLGGFDGFYEQLYEGSIMVIAAGLISWMIVWMLRQSSRIAHHLRAHVDRHLESGSRLGVFILVLLSVLRDGIETVLLLKASAIESGANNVIAALLGILVAALLGYILFSGLRKFSMKHFFTVSTILLILFAAGLCANAVGEFQEAGFLTFGAQPAWDIGSTFLNEDTLLGGLLRGLFGWNAHPSLLQVGAYFGYLIVIASTSRLNLRKL